MGQDRSPGLFGLKVLHESDAEHHIRGHVECVFKNARPVQVHHFAIARATGKQRKPVFIRIDNVIGPARESREDRIQKTTVRASDFDD
jgi:hypothetical protein